MCPEDFERFINISNFCGNVKVSIENIPDDNKFKVEVRVEDFFIKIPPRNEVSLSFLC